MKIGSTEHAWALEAIARMDDALLVVDEDARPVYTNPAADRMGVRDLEPDPSRWTDRYGIFRADERTPFPAEDFPLLRALQGEDSRDVPMFVRAGRPNGVHLLLSSTALRGADGRIRGAAVLFRDVTQQRRRDAQLREAEGQRKAILDNIPDIAWLKDKEGRFVLVNQRLAEAAGRTKVEDVIGLTDFDIWPRELAEGYVADDNEVMQTGKHKFVEEEFENLATNQRYWIETVKTRILDDHGNVLGTTGIAHDITARKLAHIELEQRVHERTQELREAQQNLVRQERLAILGQLAGGVAHQIRNPLAAILNATYVLKRHLVAPQHSNVDDAIRIIHDEVRHANIIITGLLDYARVRTPDRHPASIVELLERLLAADWIPPNVRVVCQLPTDDPVTRDVDADQLTGALSNLVRNGVEAMPNGGELRVSLSTDPAGAVSIIVADDGTGISPQVRAHLFEPLHSSKPSGIGLGLVTARRFIEAHGGTITLRDASRGASFEVRLPAP
ncbi:MAG: PAS domain-containing protein [Labilithrix sp.]|nr:PAS domain-containing protein [Labilithrix sp.]MCW5818178.1 PAS domain-containing protein [Labilithrix sp.]